MTDQPDPTLDPRQANFRRRAAMWALAQQAALTVALLWRDKDLGTNTADLLTWITAGNAATIAVAIGSKALEQFLIARGGGSKGGP